MREIKFRAWDKENQEMVYSEKEYMDYQFVINSKSVICINIEDYDDSFGYTQTSSCVLDNIMQSIGLKDGTKWEQLTEQERLDFYNKNKSEDGITIKYQNVDDVKHLWKGKEIYEGDILKFEDMGEEGYEYKEGYDFINRAVVVFEDGRFTLDKFIDCNSGVVEELNDYEELINTIQNSEVIGNIYENPELLEVN